MAKKMTKAQREKAKRDRLYQQIHLVVSGACGRDFDEGNEWLTAEELSRAIPALKDLVDDEELAHLFGPQLLHQYETIGSITDLYLSFSIESLV